MGPRCLRSLDTSLTRTMYLTNTMHGARLKDHPHTRTHAHPHLHPRVHPRPRTHTHTRPCVGSGNPISVKGLTEMMASGDISGTVGELVCILSLSFSLTLSLTHTHSFFSLALSLRLLDRACLCCKVQMLLLNLPRLRLEQPNGMQQSCGKDCST